MIPSTGFIICYESSQNPRKHFTGKDNIKETDEQPEEEVNRVKSGRVPEHRSFCLCGVRGVPPSRYVDSFTNREAFQTLSLKVITEVPLTGMID